MRRLSASVRFNRVLPACGVAMGLCVLAGPAASLTVETAAIEGGALMVEGRTTKKNKTVTLDGDFTTRSGGDKRFAFSILYHPGDCIVRLRQGAKRADALVANCGLEGPKGKKGARGNTGPQGVQGDRGLKGNTGDTGAKGDQGEPGPQGSQGVKGEKGDKGDQGEQGEAGIGAGHFWMQYGDIPAGGSVALVDGDGQPISRYRGIISCIATGTTQSTNRQLSSWFVGRASASVGHIDELSPASPPDEYYPIVFNDAGVLSVKLNVDSGNAESFRCRMDAM